MNSSAAVTVSTPRSQITLEQAVLCARIGDENKAKNVVILDMRGITPLYDYFVLLNGSSRRHVHTIAEEIDAAMHEQGEKRRSIAGYQSARWVVQDYGDIVVHVFDPEAREYYALEELWADAPQLDWKNM